MFTLAPRALLAVICSSLGLACQGDAAPTVSETESTGASTSADAPTMAPVPTSTMPPDEEDPTSTTVATNMSTTDDDPGTGSSGADTTVGASACGDGVVGANEECDEGLDINDDSRFCTKICKLNICGDGKLFVDWELCDEGAANSDAYGSLCGEQCEPGARCGDNKLQPDFETCDLGPDNGSMKGDDQEIQCDANCRAMQLRAFVTRDVFTGNLGGLFAADQKCRAAATAAGLAEPGRFRAFLSTGDLDAKERFEAVTISLPYVLVTGKKIAENFGTLIETGPLEQGISVTEYGVALFEATVVTNTQPGGVRYNDTDHCQSWTSADGNDSARAGHSGVPANAPDADAWQANQWWTGFVSWPCDMAFFHIYCLEI